VNRTGVVYAVTDPRAPADVRYIGATVQPLAKRARQHLSRNAAGLRPSAHPRYNGWLDQLEHDGVVPQFTPVRTGVPLRRLHVAEAAEMHRHVRRGHDLLQDIGILPEEALVHARDKELRVRRMFPTLARIDSPGSRLARGEWTAGFAFLKRYLTTCNPQRWS
jgi:hypothetical protein